MSFQKTICDAIRDRRILEFRYKGGWRSVEPHALGYGPKDKLTLCAWQVAGGSGADWRDFHVDQISDLVASNEFFDDVRPGFNPGDRTHKSIVCSL